MPASSARRRTARLAASIVVAGLAGLSGLAWAPAAGARPVGNQPLDDIILAAQQQARPACGLTAAELVALMLGPVFNETGATGSVAPSPMTLSRWDRHSNLFYGSNPATAYQRAYFNPGIGMWQMDSAGLGRPHAANYWIDTSTAAPVVARTMADRYCAAVNAGYTPQEVRTHVWLPWHACNSGACQAVYDEIYANGQLRNLTRIAEVTRTGGMQARLCRLADNRIVGCRYVNPALAEGYGAGSTAWANPAVVSTQSPLSAPFYVYELDGREHRHWIRADTGYDIEITASRLLTANARSGLTWTAGPGLCDVNTQRGSCEVVPPLGPLVPAAVTHPSMVGPGAGPGVVGWGDGRVAVVERRADGTIRVTGVNGDGRDPWSYLGGAAVADPDISSWGTDRLDVFVRGADHGLWTRTWTPAGWGAWRSLGGSITSAPTAVSWGPNRIDVFARGGDGALWSRALTNTTWTPWYTLGGGITSDPEVASTDDGRLDVFAVGLDQQLWTRAWTGSRWTPWAVLGGGLTSSPGATASSATRLTVAARGLDGALWVRQRESGAWGSWRALGGGTDAAPDLGPYAPDLADVVVRGLDGWLWDRRQTGATSYTGWRLLA